MRRYKYTTREKQNTKKDGNDCFNPSTRMHVLSVKLLVDLGEKRHLAFRPRAIIRPRFDPFGSPFSSKIVVYGHCLATLPTQLIKL